jgi:hypothetical protein
VSETYRTLEHALGKGVGTRRKGDWCQLVLCARAYGMLCLVLMPCKAPLTPVCSESSGPSSC